MSTKLMRHLCASLCAMTLAGSAGAIPSSDDQKPPQGVSKQQSEDQELILRAAAAARSNDCDTILKLLTSRIDRSPRIEPSRLAVFAYELETYCYAVRRDNKTAYRYALIGTALPEASQRLWQMRLGIELNLSELTSALTTIEALAKERPQLLNALPQDLLGQLEAALIRKDMIAEQKRLLAVMVAPSYKPTGSLLPTLDGARSRYAALLVKDGARAEATALIRQITVAAILTRMTFDPRFKALIPSEFDDRAATEQQLIKMQALIADHPDMLDLLLEAAQELRTLGRPDEALLLLKSAETHAGGAAASVDSNSRLVWWWDGLARTYHQLGNYERMVEAFRNGGVLDEDGNPNVSQIINLASAQIDFGRPDDALATISEFKLLDRGASPYGIMQMRFAHGCASALAGHAEQAQADLTYIRDHQKDDPTALSSYYLCLKDRDQAAAQFIQLLEDPDRTADTLLRLSQFDDPPPGGPDDPLDKEFRAVRDRPDVKAAIAKAGGTRRIHLQAEGLW